MTKLLQLSYSQRIMQHKITELQEIVIERIT